MASVLDPRMLAAYPLDEPGSTDVRKSIASLVHNLSPVTATGSDGVPTVADGIAGRAVNLLQTISGLTTTNRYLRGAEFAWDEHPLYVPLPRSVGATGLSYGYRFMFKNAGGTSTQGMVGLGRGGTNSGPLGLNFIGSGGSPNRGRLYITMPDISTESIVAGSWTDTDGLVAALTSDYIQQNEWWRVAVRYNHSSGTSYIVQVVLSRESTGARYRLTRAAFSSDWALPTAPVRFYVGLVTSTIIPFQGYIDDVWFLNGDLSEESAIDNTRAGLAISREDDATYRAKPRVILDALFDDDSGVQRNTTPQFIDEHLLAAVPARAGAEAFSIRMRSYAPGRPMVPKWMSGLYIQKGRSRGSVR